MNIKEHIKTSKVSPDTNSAREQLFLSHSLLFCIQQNLNLIPISLINKFLRMQSIEVLKGASMLKYGPQTTGGVLNMISTPLPTSLSGRVSTFFGQNNQMNSHIYFGDGSGPFKFLFIVKCLSKILAPKLNAITAAFSSLL